MITAYSNLDPAKRVGSYSLEGGRWINHQWFSRKDGESREIVQLITMWRAGVSLTRLKMARMSRGGNSINCRCVGLPQGICGGPWPVDRQPTQQVRVRGVVPLWLAVGWRSAGQGLDLLFWLTVSWSGAWLAVLVDGQLVRGLTCCFGWQSAGQGLDLLFWLTVSWSGAPTDSLGEAHSWFSPWRS